MTNFLVKIKNLSVITILASLIIGIILIIRPDGALHFVSLFCGASIILLGIGSWIYFFAKDNSVFMAVTGTLALITGIVVCVKYKSIISFFLIVFGVFLIVSGIVDLVSAFNVKSIGVRGWIFPMITAIATVILGIIITVNPFSSVIFATRLLGIALLVYAVTDIIAFFQVKKALSLKTVVDSDVTEIDISQEDIEN